MAPGFFPVRSFFSFLEFLSDYLSLLELLPSTLAANSPIFTAISTFATWRARTQPRNDAQPTIYGPERVPRSERSRLIFKSSLLEGIINQILQF